MAIDQLLPTSGGIQGAISRVASSARGAADPSGGADFAQSLSNLLDGVEKTAAEANTAVAGMTDKSVEVHDAMIAMQRAEMQLQLTVQVRNKLVSAYQEIMRMSI